MPPNNVAVSLDLGRALLRETLLDVSPGQMNDDDVSVRRFVGMDAEIFQSPLGLQVEVDGFARPTPGVSLQGLFCRASEIRTCDVRRGFLPGVPFRVKFPGHSPGLLKQLQLLWCFLFFLMVFNVIPNYLRCHLVS